MSHQLTLRIIAPSGAMDNEMLLSTAQARLAKLGYAVEIDPAANLIHERFAGTDAERSTSLAAALTDSVVSVVMAARGGYGAHRLLPLLNWRKLAAAAIKHDKFIVGHSDFTAIAMALFRHGAPSYAGPCAGVDFGGESVNAFMKKAFEDALDAEPLNVTVKAKQAIAKGDTFSARGMLWGGNLTMLCSLLGTPYFPKQKQIEDGILFLEDVNERPYKIERMLNQLHMAGVLGEQSVILAGDFGSYTESPYDRGYDMASVWEHVRTVLKVPVLTGLPFGHIARKATLPIGKRVSVSANATGFVLTE